MPDSSPDAAAQAVESTVTQGVTPESPTGISDAKADSSPANGAEPTILDSVKAALAPKAEEAPPASQTPDQKDAPEGEDPDGEPPDVTEEELAALSGKTRRRIEYLAGKGKTLEARVKDLEPKAAEAEQIDAFLQRSNLSRDDHVNTLQIAAMIKDGTDPHRIVQTLAPIVEHFRKQAGMELPPDLQEQVRLGYVTQEAAQEIAQLRSRTHFSDVRAQKTAEQAEQENRQREHDAYVQKSSAAATKWETAKRTSDPDWHLKTERVHELIKLHVMETRSLPQVADLDGIYEKVTKEIKRFRPATTEMKRPESDGSSARTRPEPTTILEVVRQAVTGVT